MRTEEMGAIGQATNTLTVKSTTVTVVVMNRCEWYEGRIKCIGNRVCLRHVTARMNFLVKLNYISVVKHNLMQNEKENYKLY
jgi:hypothetical protein